MSISEQEKENILDILFKSTGVEIDQNLIDLIDKEGDFEEWTDTYSGYLCRIRRVRPYSCWCGYVRVPEGHNSYGKNYDDVSIEVHGGLTFGSNNFPDKNEENKGFFWFGFDCGHSGDMIPDLWEKGTYRTKEYVKDEVTDLAKQLKNREGC